MLRKNARITVYAKSGRISIKTLREITKDHIDSNNKTFAQKALNEYIAAINLEYKQNADVATELQSQINRLK